MSAKRPDPPSFSPSGAPPSPSARGARVVGPPKDRVATDGAPQAASPARASLRSGQQSRPPATPPAEEAAALPPVIAPANPAPAPQWASSRTTPTTPAPTRPARPAAQPPAGRPAARRRSRVLPVTAVALALLLAWPIGLLVWANGRIQHTAALSGAAGTPGTTYLLVGSDSRSDGTIPDGTEGQRSDTVLLLHVPAQGPAALVSLPRDTYLDIPGHGANKLNAAYSLGGAPLLVQTVESLTALSIDHYVEIGMGGVVTIVDAVGGVNLCLDQDVNDPLSELVWTAGCHDVDGRTALAFARMRYADPTGDIGRQARQRQVISAVAAKAASPGTALTPTSQLALIDAGTGALLTDDRTGILDLGRLALAFRSATGDGGLSGTPPIADYDYRPGAIGSTVLLDAAAAPVFFQRLRDGELTDADFAR